MKKAGFYTLGCKVNQYETQAMIEMFKKSDFEVVDFEQAADVYVINTCTVTSFGDKKSRQIIRRAKRLNSNAVVAVVGCYSQIAPEEVAKIQGVDVIVGTSQKNEIVNLVNSAFEGKKSSIVTDISKQFEFEETGIIAHAETTRAFIKIQEGCQNFCSYCVIPYSRGPNRSRKVENVLKEVSLLANNGFKEIVLTGININSFGKDTKEDSLIGLIKKIADTEIERIRIGSLEQDIITKDFVDFAANTSKLCPHFHISLQSGCDSVLKRMNRRYTTSEYLSKIAMLREYIPDVSVTTDIMVGFPGETEEEFQETLEFLKKISFTRMHVFKYSPRKGTPAAIFPNQVEPEQKEIRSNILLQLSDENERIFYGKFLGKSMKVLVEQEVPNKKGFIEGHTANFIKIIARGSAEKVGSFTEFKIREVEKGYCLGD